MLLLLSEEATNFKTRSIALASMVIEEKYTLGDSKYITIIKLFLLVNPSLLKYEIVKRPSQDIMVEQLSTSETTCLFKKKYFIQENGKG
jgi:hypothetical protein